MKRLTKLRSYLIVLFIPLFAVFSFANIFTPSVNSESNFLLRRIIENNRIQKENLSLRDNNFVKNEANFSSKSASAVSPLWINQTGEVAGWFQDPSSAPHPNPHISNGGNFSSIGAMTQGPGLTMTNAVVPNSVTVFREQNVEATSLATARTNGEYIFASLTVATNSPSVRISQYQFNQTPNQTGFVHPATARMALALYDVTNNTETIIAQDIIISGTTVLVTPTITTPPTMLAGRTYQLRHYFYPSNGVAITSPSNYYLDNPRFFIATNEAPVAANDTFIYVAENSATINVASNDSDPENDTRTITQVNGTNISVGGSVTISGQGTVTLNSDGTLTFSPNSGFTGTPSFTYTISDGNNNTATATVTGIPVFAHKSVRISNDTVPTGVINIGDQATYTIWYSNTNSTTVIPNFQINDVLPSGLTITSTGAHTITVSGTGTSATKNNSYTGATSGSVSNLLSAATLGAGGRIRVDIPVNITSAAIKSNQATGSSSSYTTSISTDNVDNTTTGLPSGVTIPTGSVSQTQTSAISPTTFTVLSPDLTIAKSHTPTTFVRGSTGTYNLTVSNSGTAATGGTITVVDTLPTGLTRSNGAVTLSGDNAANWTCNAASNVITCSSSISIPTSGTSAFSFVVNVAANAAVSVTNNVTVSGGGEDAGNNGNNTASDVTPTVGVSDLTISKTDSGSSFTVGSTGTYSFTVRNNGDTATSGEITVTDTLPTGLTVNGGAAGSVTSGGANAANWTCNSNALTPQTVTCTSSNVIAPSATSVFTFSVNVGTNSPIGTNAITNTATVAGGGEINTSNNSGSDQTTVLSSNLAIAKSHTPTTFVRGSTGTYNLTVSNTGNAATSGTITVVDTLPTGLTISNGAVTLSGTNSANWTCNAASNVITCTSSTAITTSGTNTFSFVVNVAMNAAASVTNSVTVSGGNEATANNSNNSASDVTPTVGIPVVSISKSSNGPWIVGQTNSSYTLTVSNIGSAATTGTITVRDALPLGIGIRPASGFNPAVGWTCSYPFETTVGHNGVVTNSLITCTSSTSIAAGASVNLNIPVVATSLSPSSVTNRVSVSGGGDSSFTDPSNYAGVTSCSNSTHCTSNTTTVTQLPAPPATCAVGSVRNLISTPLIGGHTQNGGAAIIANATLISGANNYSVGTGTGARFVVDMAWRWNNGVGDNSAASTLDLQVNGTTYATLTTFNQYPGYAVLTTVSGASLPNGATTMEVYRYTFENMWVTLPASVTSINSANIVFRGGNDGGGDDFNYQINAINACGATLGVTKSSNGPWAINQPSASYTLNVSNTGQSTFGTATVLDTLPTGITAKWTGTHSSGIWNCTFSGQIVTCSTTTVMTTGATNAITLPVNVTPSAPIGTNSITNYASIGGGGDPFNNGITQTPGVACSDSVHCATNQTTINSNPPNIELVKSCPNPADCTSAPQLPGTELTYQINFANTGGLSAANLAIVDGVPANTDFKVGSAIVNVGSTGLTFVIEYSADYDPLNLNLATWGYTPVTGGGGAAAGYDRLVKAVRWRVTSGNLSSASPNNSGNVSFITKIR